MKFDPLRRRDFITWLGASAVAWPLAARAQQIPTVAIVGTATPSSWKDWVVAFEQRLREFGWIEGRTVAFAYRWTEGNNARLSEFAAELARLKPDVILTTGTGVPALRQAISDIPIVFALGRDPVADGLVQSLARPGGTVTGLSSQSTELAGKRLDLLREIVPYLRKLAVIAEADDPAAMLERDEVEAAAKKLGLEIVTMDIGRPDQNITPAFQELKGKVEAIYCGAGVVTTVKRAHIFAEALAVRLPTISGLRVYAQAGSLLTYGADYADLFRRAGDYVHKILRGTKAGEIPVEQPTKFELIVNLKTAKDLGLSVPSSFLLRADEVIE